MKKRNTFLVLAVFCIYDVWSQSFDRGYIMNGESKVDGLIQYNPKKGKNNFILFKKTESESSQKMTADQVTGFYLESYKATFASHVIKPQNEKVFMEVTVDGPLKLMSQFDSYVLSKGDTGIQIDFPLKKMSYGDVNQSKKEMNERNLIQIRLAGSIKFFLSDCNDPKIESKLSEITQSGLAYVAQQYNQCKGVSVEKKKSRLEPGLMIGYNMTSIKFSDPAVNVFEGQPTFKAGLSLDFRPAKYQTKAMLSLQLVYMEEKYKVKSDALPYLQVVDLNHKTFRVPLSVKLFFKSGQKGFFINPGVSVVFNSGKQSTSSLGPGAYFEPVPVMFTGLIGIGYEWKLTSGSKLSAALRFENTGIGSTFHETIYLSESSQNYIQFDLAYKFAGL